MYHTNNTEIRIPDEGRKMRRNKKKLRKPVILGFIILYLAAMGLATCLMELKYEDEFLQNYRSKVSQACQLVREEEKSMPPGMPDEHQKAIYLHDFSSVFILGDHKYQQFSGALYNQNGKLLAESKSCLPTYHYPDPQRLITDYFPVSDCLTEEETAHLAGYVARAWQENKKNPKSGGKETALDKLTEYRFITYTDSNSQELYRIYVQRILLETEGIPETDPFLGTFYSAEPYPGAAYHQTENELLWQWENPRISDAPSTIFSHRSIIDTFPYIINGFHAWKSWEENRFLHEFPSELKEEEYKALGEFDASFSAYADFGRTGNQIKEEYTISLDDGADYHLILAADSHPWIAAVSYMKYAYLTCFVLMLACMVKIIYVTERAYHQQESMEEMRRNFTNAIAHELKTPLGIIRGFAENLQEHTREEKRAYYLEQIIGQTEEIDRLAAQMIAVSKIDSKHLVLQKEIVSMSGLIQEQLIRFSPMIKEKNLQIQCTVEEDFLVEGDRDYLEKAVWNLLSNAVMYNIQDGRIRIHIKAGCCIIENTGSPLSKEQSSHVFDMFYSSDKSRGSRDKHTGLGLFLTKKILELHHLDIGLENTSSGVRAVIAKNIKKI